MAGLEGGPSYPAPSPRNRAPFAGLGGYVQLSQPPPRAACGCVLRRQRARMGA
jgi:hypothetical protein